MAAWKTAWRWYVRSLDILGGCLNVCLTTCRVVVLIFGVSFAFCNTHSARNGLNARFSRCSLSPSGGRPAGEWLYRRFVKSYRLYEDILKFQLGSADFIH